MPYHGELDRAREGQVSVAKIGTTGRGIGPCYEDKVGRRVIRVADLADAATLELRVDRALLHHNPLRKGLGLEPVDRAGLLAQLRDIAAQILPYAAPVWKVLNEKRKAGKRILFEGAQGALLDIDFGTYPFVTSSNVIAGQAATGTGIGPGAIDYVLGITKAYTTRVGEGPFQQSWTMLMASNLANVGMSLAPPRGVSAAAVGSMPVWCGKPAPPLASTASH